MAKGYLYDNGDELITREDVNELPDTTSASQGDVLSLNSSKEPVWSTPSGGGGGITTYYLDKDNIEHETIGTDYYDLTPLKKSSDNTQVTYNDIVNGFSSGVCQVQEITEDGFVTINSLAGYGITDNPNVPTYTHIVTFNSMELTSKGATSYLYLVEGGVPPQ